MPILVMALLALIIFGTIGILLVVAVIMERSPGNIRRDSTARTCNVVRPTLHLPSELR